ncbi:MAG: RAMP superfamily CRISPR-associated protein [Gemmataceae bacterium]|nr:RAMP superfamily CRISPR-associated protein [Gemmataceae bacterium]
MATSTMAQQFRLRSRLQVRGHLVFDTGWRIGTGREGQTSDLGVLLDAAGQPMLPGSSIKGKLRSTCEALAPALNLRACLLNVEASGVGCASDVRWYSRQRESYRQALEAGIEERLAWIRENTCDVCQLFGSPVQAARLRCSDGTLVNPGAAVVRVRDGVVLDRDSHTAADGLKYDYETVAAGTRFEVVFDLDNPTPADEALFGAALFEWASGSSLGGFTSRGLGRFHLENITLRGVDLDNPQERLRYLTRPRPEDKLNDRGDWQTYFQRRIENHLQTSTRGN